jgi:hypothetical protein
LGLALAQTPACWEVPHKEVAQACVQAPSNTRAAVRSQAMRLLQKEGCSYYIDWEIIGAEGGTSLHMLNPFDSGAKDAETWIHLLNEVDNKISRRGKVGAGL